MENFVLVIHILASSAVIGLVLLQHGKGADMGAAFGSGSSGSLFGVSGSSNLLSNLTAVFVSVFFVTSLSLAYMASHKAEQSSVIKGRVLPTAPKKVESTTDKALTDVPTDRVPSAKDVPN